MGELGSGTYALAAPTVHSWTVPLERGHLVDLSVGQESVDVVLHIVRPNGELEYFWDGPGVGEPERVVWIATMAGDWTVEISAFAEGAAGEYILRGVEPVQAPASTLEDWPSAKAQLLHEMARAVAESESPEAAIAYYQQAIAATREASDPTAPPAVDLHNELALLLEQLGRTEEVGSLYRKAIAMLEADNPKDYASLGTIRGNLGVFLQRQEQHDAAVEALLEAREETARGGGEFLPVYLESLGALYRAQGRYAEAEPLFERALEIVEADSEPDRLLVARGLANLGGLYEAQGRYAEAEPLLDHALAILETVYPAAHPETATALKNLASLYDEQGRYAEAEPLYERALEIQEAAYEPGHPWIATTLNNLAALYHDQGRYAEAEPLYERALDLFESAYGPRNSETATALNNLALLYKDQGRYAEAEPLFEGSLEVFEEVYEPGHPSIATALNNLAILFQVQGRHAEAGPLYQRALEIKEAAHEPGHPGIARTLGSLAVLYQAQSRYAEAETLYERALEIEEAVYEPGHPEIATTLNNLASLYKAQGRYAEAEPVFERALEIADRPEADPTLRILGRHGLALVLRATERPDEATDLLREAIDEVESFRATFGGDEELQADFLARHSGLYVLMTRWLLEAGEVEEALEYAERGRAQVLLDQLAMGQVDLLEGLAPELRDDLRTREAQAQARLSEYQQRITIVRSREDLSEQERLAQIETLTDSVRAADEAFRAVYREIKNLSPLWQRTLTRGGETARLREVQREVVGQNGLLLLYELGPEWSGLFVIPPGGGDVEVVDLELDADAAARLEVEAGVLTPELMRELVGRGARGALAAGSPRGDGPSRSGTLGPELVERLTTLREVLVPDHVWERVKAADQVVVIPDGPLYELPFETLVTAAGEEEVLYWIDEGPPVRYGPSMTVLVNLEQERSTRPIGLTRQGGILSVSDPVYDPRQIDLLAEETAEDELLPRRSGVTRDSYERLGGSLAPLPGTALETDSILAAFGDDPTLGGVTVLSGADATELAVRDTLGAFRFVHLATHGLVDQGRSSLFASLAFTPPARTETSATHDGFLQLHEIYGLRIPEVELAVLSACESNVGDVVEGEGVFALSRGFLVAGASRVIASQWAVNDESTAVLMSVFFREVAEAERRAESVDYARALRTAQLAIKNHPDHPEWANPYYWAPFVLTGKR